MSIVVSAKLPKRTMSLVWWGVDDQRMCGRLMCFEWVVALGLCCNHHHWATTTSITHLHQRDITRPSNQPLHLYPCPPCLSLSPDLSHFIIFDQYRQISAVYTSTKVIRTPLCPLTDLRSDPSQLNLFTSTLDHKSLIHYPTSHSYHTISTFCNYPNHHVRSLSAHTISL